MLFNRTSLDETDPKYWVQLWIKAATINGQRWEGASQQISTWARKCNLSNGDPDTFVDVRCRLQNYWHNDDIIEPTTTLSITEIIFGIVIGAACVPVVWFSLPAVHYFNVVGSSTSFLAGSALGTYGGHKFNGWWQRSDKQRMDAMMKKLEESLQREQRCKVTSDMLHEIWEVLDRYKDLLNDPTLVTAAGLPLSAAERVDLRPEVNFATAPELNAGREGEGWER